ncbi:MAG TPA: S8 family serine peptidase [Candidatus Acidoferrum sp.]|jgi:subtilase family serine protease|nr:S8 family serine peptidase [Candidatus Acidoferrum sp.]
MKISSFSALAFSCAAFVLLPACTGTQPPVEAPATQGVATSIHAAPQWQAKHLARAACPQVVGKPTCFALISNKNGLSPLSGCNPSSTCGFTAIQLEQAYNLTGSLGKGSGQIVAVIEAGDDPDAATTFAGYRSQYKLGTGTMVKYNEDGQQSNYPPSCEDYGWCVETDLDIEMVSAACPKCTVYLMEAKDGSTISDFEQAEKEAVKLGATILSNSWGCYGSNDCGDSNFQNYFNTPGIAYLAATGDEGYGQIGAPAVLASVIAVGGTQLALSGSKYSESIWDGAGGGCATGITKPSWQHDPDCSSRTVGDVSSEAGVSPGVAVYSALYGGWGEVGGTSVASPFSAGVIGLAGNATSQDGGKNFWTLTKNQHKRYFHHPTGGGGCSNYLCGAGRYKKYYSGPGGWGSPNGIRGY